MKGTPTGDGNPNSGVFHEPRCAHRWLDQQLGLDGDSGHVLTKDEQP